MTPKSIAWGVNLVTVWFCKKIGSKSRIVVERVFCGSSSPPVGGRGEGRLTPKSIAWGVNLVTVWFCKKIGSKSRIVVERVFFH